MNYLLTIDVGNTNTVFGLYEGDELKCSWRIITKKEYTSDELGIYLNVFIQSAGYNVSGIKDVIYSSVVPSINPIIERTILDYYQVNPIKISYDMPLPLQYAYPRPYELGADRIVNAVGGITLYGDNLIIIDLGTATTFCLIKNRNYMGGVIAPGLKMSIESLHTKTALLPLVEFAKPPNGIIGKSTVESMQAGFFYGWIGLLKGIISELMNLYPSDKFLIIGTGGLSAIIHKEVPDIFDIFDKDLTLKGLKIIYDYVKGR